MTTTETKPAAADPAKPTTADTTSADTKSADAPPAKPTEPAKPAEAPAAYADFKVPEGFTLSKETLEAALPVFKELGLTQDQAQKLVDIQAAREAQLLGSPKAEFESLNADWRAKTANDPEIKAYSVDGKTGIDAAQVDIGRALAAIGNPTLAKEFGDAMTLTGAGNNPAVFKVWWKMAQMIGEGKSVSGGDPSPHGQRATGGPKPSAAQSIYPNLPSANAG